MKSSKVTSLSPESRAAVEAIQLAYHFAAELVRNHVDSDSIDEGDLERAFVGVYERLPDDDDRANGLWSLICAGCEESEA